MIEVLSVALEKDGHIGRGEAAGVYYKNDTPVTMLRQLKSAWTTIEAGMTRELLQQALPAGGARNAVDCALWDLEAKLGATRVWELAGLEEPRAILTTFTCGAGAPEQTAQKGAGLFTLSSDKTEIDRRDS